MYSEIFKIIWQPYKVQLPPIHIIIMYLHKYSVYYSHISSAATEIRYGIPFTCATHHLRSMCTYPYVTPVGSVSMRSSTLHHMSNNEWVVACLRIKLRLNTQCNVRVLYTFTDLFAKVSYREDRNPFELIRVCILYFIVYIRRKSNPLIKMRIWSDVTTIVVSCLIGKNSLWALYYGIVEQIMYKCWDKTIN